MKNYQKIIGMSIVAGALALGNGHKNTANAQSPVLTAESRRPDLDYLLLNASTKEARSEILLSILRAGLLEKPEHIDESVELLFERYRFYPQKVPSYYVGIDMIDEVASRIKSQESKNRFYSGASHKIEEGVEGLPKVIMGGKNYDTAWWLEKSGELAEKGNDKDRATKLYKGALTRRLALIDEYDFEQLINNASMSIKLDDEDAAKKFYAAAMIKAEKTGDYKLASEAAAKLGDTSKVTYYQNLQKFLEEQYKKIYKLPVKDVPKQKRK